MTDGTRASLLLLALLSSLGVVPIVLRGARRFALLALHAMGVFVAFAATLSAPSTEESSALGVPYLAMLVLVAVDRRRRRARRGLRVVASAAVVVGLLVAVAARLWPMLAPGGAVVAALSAVVVVAMGVHDVRRAPRPNDEDPARGAVLMAASLVVAALAVVASVLTHFGLGHSLRLFWPLALGAAGSVVSSLCIPPHTPPTRRELVVALLLGVAAFFVVTALVGFEAGLVAAVALALFDIGLVATSRPLLEGASLAARPRAREVDAPPQAPPEILPPDAVAALSPLLDDAGAQKRPRSTVAVRSTGQYLLDAAVDHARSLRDRAQRKRARVTTIVEDGDADIECDPSELALVLGDLVALASSEPREGEAASTQVRLRAGPRQITWEITGEQIDESGPTLLDAPFSLKDGALVGLTLARARLAVERHGGTLVYRLTDAGHFIQVTVPRRLERTKAARA